MAAFPAFAQEVDNYEIIVTAQKIEQRLVDVPISMTVLDASELADRRVQGVEDFILSIPNVTYLKGDRGGGAALSIRGVSGGTGGSFSPVNVTVDDIPLSAISSHLLMSIRSFDLERVETLRGPQGTLTGANALGGILNFVSAKPDTNAFSAKLTGDIGRFGAYLGNAVVNIPLSDTVATRFMVYGETVDGATKNVGPAGGSSSTDNYGGRAAIRFQPTSDFTLDASVLHERQSFGINDHVYIDQFDDGPNATSERRAWVLQNMAEIGMEYQPDGISFWENGGDNNGGRVSMDYPERDRFRHTIATLSGTYDFGAHALALSYGYFKSINKPSWDADRTEAPFFITDVRQRQSSHSLEARISSDYEGPFNWVAGVAYHDERARGAEVGSTSQTTLIAFEGMDPADVVGNPDEYNLHDYVFLEKSSLKTKAAFANVFFDITPSVHLAAGARYTRVDARIGNACCGGEDMDFGFPLNGATLAERIADLPPITMPKGILNRFDPRVAINFDLSDNIVAYAQFATGFRPSTGNDPRIVEAGIANAIARPEKARNYEIGIKGHVLDNQIWFSAAVFQMDYTDLQVGRDAEIPIAGSLEGELYLGYTDNAGKATVKGFEFETSFKVTSDFKISGALGYVDSRIKNYDDVNFKPGLPMAAVRPWTGSGTVEYGPQISDDLWAKFRIDAQFQSAAYTTFLPEDRVPGNHLPGFETVDVSVGLEGNSWDVTGYFTNVFNEKYYTNQTNWSFRPTVYYIPRTFGIRFTKRFGG